MQSFFNILVRFLKEIILFGLDAFMVAAAREVARRFWVRLESRGGTIEAIEQKKPSFQRIASGNQSSVPFFDEYQD